MTTTMKKIYSILLSFVVAMTALTSCSTDNDIFTSATENDDPRFLRPNTLELGQTAEESILRTENFEMEVLVIPVDFTKVQWIENDEVIAEGKTISKQFTTGLHTIKVLATTTVGKTTERYVNLTVLPLETDPTLAEDAKSRWFQIGTKKTISGANLAKATALYIAGTAVSDFTVNGDELSFTIPASITEGEHLVEVETADGKFACGTAHVTNEKWVEPGIQEVSIWEGNVVANWGDSKVELTPADLANVPVGTKIKVQISFPEAEYHALRVTNTDWSYDFVPQIDDIHTKFTDGIFELEYTKEFADKIASGTNMLITGFGYEISKVFYEKQVAPAETELWTGETVINWGDANVTLTPEQLSAVKAGKKMVLYFDFPEAEYYSLRITNTDWSFDFVPQIDGIKDTYADGHFEFEITPEFADKLTSTNMVITGFGYRLAKVTLK